MRLWHKDLIKYLPRKQLLSQWRECCCIARNIKVDGTPNHMLVNKILDYDESHFICYTFLIINEMRNRKYNVNGDAFFQHISEEVYESYFEIPPQDIFIGWHNNRYYNQCYHNLEEKYDCGGLTQDEWNKIKK